MRLGELLGLYLLGAFATLGPAAWMSVVECKQSADPASVWGRGVKRHLAAVVLWDSMGSGAFGIAVFGLQKVSGLRLTTRLDHIDSGVQQAAILGMVMVAAAFTGTSGRRAIGHVQRLRVLARVQQTQGDPTTFRASSNPKRRALEKIGDIRDDRVTEIADGYLESLKAAGIMLPDLGRMAKLFFRARFEKNVNSLTARTMGDVTAISLSRMDTHIDGAVGRDRPVADDANQPEFSVKAVEDDRFRYIIMLMLENGGASRLTRLGTPSEDLGPGTH